MKNLIHTFFTVLFIFLLSSCAKEDFTEVADLNNNSETTTTEAGKLIFSWGCNFNTTLPFIGGTWFSNDAYNCADKLKAYYNSCLPTPIIPYCPDIITSEELFVNNDFNENIDFIYQHISTDGFYKISPAGQIALNNAISQVATEYKNNTPALSAYSIASLAWIQGDVSACCTDQPYISFVVNYKKTCKGGGVPIVI